jgi:hypothetical protein
MKGHVAKTILLIFSISFLQLLPVPYRPVPDGRAQESGLKVGGYQWGGDIEMGYRFTDIDGRNRYKETVNLMGGAKLFDLNLWGNDPEKKGLVDTFRLNLNSIGDPFPSGRFEIKKSKAYDLTASYREYKYFFARTENGFQTDNFSFNQTTKRGTLALTLFPTDDLKFNVGYNRVQRDGDAGVPRAFIQPQEQDLDEVFNEYFAGADFSIGKVDLHVKQSYWTFENKDSIAGPVQPERRDEEVDTYVSTIKGHTQLGERWDLNAGYIYAHSSGRADLETTPVLVNPGRNTFNVNTHIVETGLSHLLRQGLLLHLDYRFDATIQDGRVTNDPAIGLTSYNAYSNTGTAQLEYIPKPNLTLRGGYRIQYRDIDFDNGEPHTGVSQGGKHPYDTDILNHGWIGSADWKPYKVLSVFGEYQGAQFNNPYTRISPESENIAKVRIKYNTPVKNLNLTGSGLWRRRVNPDQDYRVDVRDVGLAAAYQPSFLPKLTADASITYEMIQNSKDVTNEDFAPTLNQRFVFNSNATILSGGLTYEGIYRGLGARLYGSYAKTTKEDPQIYADGLISIYYKNKWLTPIVTLERTYLTDKVNRADGFRANLLTFSLKKEF